MDSARLERLFRDEYPRLVHGLAVVVGDTEAALDLAQDAFVQASRHWPRVSGYDNPAAWLRRVAFNRALNEKRRVRRWDAVAHRLARPAATDGVEPSLDFDAALRRLPRRQRAVVALFYVLDMPVAEIAGLLAISEGTVKSQLHDARRALAPQLEVDDGHR
jgi:RNA polymerase sigma-70 factor (ECF subfamily)